MGEWSPSWSPDPEVAGSNPAEGSLFCTVSPPPYVKWTLRTYHHLFPGSLLWRARFWAIAQKPLHINCKPKYLFHTLQLQEPYVAGYLQNLDVKHLSIEVHPKQKLRLTPGNPSHASAVKFCSKIFEQAKNFWASLTRGRPRPSTMQNFTHFGCTGSLLSSSHVCLTRLLDVGNPN